MILCLRLLCLVTSSQKCLCALISHCVHMTKNDFNKIWDQSPPPHSQPSVNELYLFAQKDFPGRVDIGKADTLSEPVQLGLDTIVICYCYSRVCVRRKSSQDGLCCLQGHLLTYQTPTKGKGTVPCAWLKITVKNPLEGQWSANMNVCTKQSSCEYQHFW